MQQQQWRRRQQPQQQEFAPRFLWVLLILIASLAAIYFYVIPFLSSRGGSTGSAFSGGWSVSQQRQIAFSLAQKADL